MATTLIIMTIISALLWITQIIISFVFCRKELKNKTKYCPTPPVSVVLPSFNETETSMMKTINSILNQKNIELEIIIIDDGSVVPVKVPHNSKIRLIRLNKNSGKRNAQIIGIELAKYDWICTIDSDTVLDENALFFMYQEICSQKVDAITGTVFVLNRDHNFVTKTVSCMYGLSIFQQRAEQAFFGCVTCCSGALSMYKKSIMIEHKEEYISQKIFGKECISGDDRHMTSLFLLSGHKVGWTSKAKCWTIIPSTWSSTIKQQVRWIRSNVAELAYLIKKLRQWPWPFMIFTFKLIFMYFYRIFMYITMIIVSILTQSLLPIVIVAASCFALSAIKLAVEHVCKQPFSRENSGIAYLIPYILFEFFILTPIVAYGIITPHKNGWLTRN